VTYIKSKIIAGLTVPVLALAIMKLLATTPSPPTLEADLVDLCGYEWMDDIALLIMHKKELVSSFLVRNTKSFDSAHMKIREIRYILILIFQI